MTNDEDVTISEDGQLTLVKASKQHEGEWKCLANNCEGTTEQTMKVFVKTGKKSICCTILPFANSPTTHLSLASLYHLSSVGPSIFCFVS